jgi:5'-methylthioadenosine phosphorylase
MEKIPAASFALISGSASWGIRFPEDLEEPGFRVSRRDAVFDTPWGPSQGWKLIDVDAALTADGRPRQILNVFAHGWPPERIDHEAHRRVAWVLQEAGVGKIIASSTAGSLNRAILAGDFVIASDILELHQTQHSVLPGRLSFECGARQMLCPQLAAVLQRTAGELWPPRARVYGQSSGLVAGHSWGPRYQTAAEARAYQSLGADFINHSIAPEATAAREIGACFVNSTHIVAAFSDYFVPPDESFRLDDVHGDLVRIASRISLLAIARASAADECGCRRLRNPWPAPIRTSS